MRLSVVLDSAGYSVDSAAAAFLAGQKFVSFAVDSEHAGIVHE